MQLFPRSNTDLKWVKPNRVTHKRAAQISAQEWEPYKTEILALFAQKKLSEVVQCMKSKHGFVAKPSQYKRIIHEVWGVRKTNPANAGAYAHDLRLSQDAGSAQTDVCMQDAARKFDLSAEDSPIDTPPTVDEWGLRRPCEHRSQSPQYQHHSVSARMSSKSSSDIESSSSPCLQNEVPALHGVGHPKHSDPGNADGFCDDDINSISERMALDEESRTPHAAALTSSNSSVINPQYTAPDRSKRPPSAGSQTSAHTRKRMRVSKHSNPILVNTNTPRCTEGSDVLQTRGTVENNPFQQGCAKCRALDLLARCRLSIIPAPSTQRFSIQERDQELVFSTSRKALTYTNVIERRLQGSGGNDTEASRAPTRVGFDTLSWDELRSLRDAADALATSSMFEIAFSIYHRIWQRLQQSGECPWGPVGPVKHKILAACARSASTDANLKVAKTMLESAMEGTIIDGDAVGSLLLNMHLVEIHKRRADTEAANEHRICACTNLCDIDTAMASHFLTMSMPDLNLNFHVLRAYSFKYLDTTHDTSTWLGRRKKLPKLHSHVTTGRRSEDSRTSEEGRRDEKQELHKFTQRIWLDMSKQQACGITALLTWCRCELASAQTEDSYPHDLLLFGERCPAEKVTIAEALFIFLLGKKSTTRLDNPSIGADSHFPPLLDEMTHTSGTDLLWTLSAVIAQDIGHVTPYTFLRKAFEAATRLALASNKALSVRLLDAVRFRAACEFANRTEQKSKHQPFAMRADFTYVHVKRVIERAIGVIIDDISAPMATFDSKHKRSNGIPLRGSQVKPTDNLTARSSSIAPSRISSDCASQYSANTRQFMAYGKRIAARSDRNRTPRSSISSAQLPTANLAASEDYQMSMAIDQDMMLGSDLPGRMSSVSISTYNSPLLSAGMIESVRSSIYSRSSGTRSLAHSSWLELEDQENVETSRSKMGTFTAAVKSLLM